MNDFGVGSPGCGEAGLLPFSGAYTPSPRSKAHRGTHCPQHPGQGPKLDHSDQDQAQQPLTPGSRLTHTDRQTQPRN